MGKPINTNPKSTQYNKPVDSLIQYQGRDCVLDLTVDEATELMEVYRDQQNHVTIKILNDKTKEQKITVIPDDAGQDLLQILHGDNGTEEETTLKINNDPTKEQLLEIAGNETEKSLISLVKGTNGTTETTKITIHQDNTKENILSFVTDTPNNILVVKNNNEVTINALQRVFGVYEVTDTTSISFFCVGNEANKIVMINDGLTSANKIEGVYNNGLNITVYTLPIDTIGENKKIAYFYTNEDINKPVFIVNYTPYIS